MNTEVFELVLNNFRQYLIESYHSVKKAYDIYASTGNKRPFLTVRFDEYFNDLAQTGWELLVERIICGKNENLQIYCSGSDYEAGAHARVFFRDQIPTHEIICKVKEETFDVIMNKKVKSKEYSFECFVSKINEWYEHSSPFDHVLLHENEVYKNDYSEIVVPIDQVDFAIRSYNP